MFIPSNSHIKPQYETNEICSSYNSDLLYMQQAKTVPVKWVSKPIRKLNSGVWHNLNK